MKTYAQMNNDELRATLRSIVSRARSKGEAVEAVRDLGYPYEAVQVAHTSSSGRHMCTINIWGHGGEVVGA